MTERVRRLTVGLHYCETATGWCESRMVFRDRNGDGVPREVILKITSPYDLLYIEEQIAKIRAEWSRQLAVRS